MSEPSGTDARLDRIEALEREVERRIPPEQVEKLIEMAEPVMAELYAAACADAKEAEARVAECEARLGELEAALRLFVCECSSNCDWAGENVCANWIARVALAASERKE